MTSGKDLSENRHLDPKRAETVALGGLTVQVLVTTMAGIFAGVTASLSLGFSALYSGIAVAVWLITFIHLRFKRLAEEERYELDLAEQRRKAQGLEKLFDDEGDSFAIRNLKHLETVIAPAVSIILSMCLLSPVFYLLYKFIVDGKGLATVFQEQTPIDTRYVLAAAAVSVCSALACFLLGMYASGLSQNKVWAQLRAGAGMMLATATFLFMSLVAIFLSSKGWLGALPDNFVGAAVFLWMVVQAIEIAANFVLDFYRPRISGVEARPAYDSRLSGLLAEPQGIFHTFAHTMDYQFGFKVSETWFFRFLEKAFAPLILIQALAFYLLSCFFVVLPGEAAIVERWGAPRGVEVMPKDSDDWDRLAAPLGPGLHVKWPWPVETAQIFRREILTTVHIGFGAEGEEEAMKKGREIANKVVAWDKSHIKDETHYLMPLPPQMELKPEDKAFAETEKEIDLNMVELADGKSVRRTSSGLDVDALFISGYFTLEYSMGDKPGDPYRYIYTFQNREKAIRALFEREICSYFAGADFWQVMTTGAGKARETILENLKREIGKAKLGIKVVRFNIMDVHPPAGEVGKAFQEILSSRQEQAATIYDGEIKAREVLGTAPSVYNEKVSQAKAYQYRRDVVAKAEKSRFVNQNKAYNTAPWVYMMRTRLDTLDEALSERRKLLMPSGLVTVIDNTKAITPSALEEALVNEAQNK